MIGDWGGEEACIVGVDSFGSDGVDRYRRFYTITVTLPSDIQKRTRSYAVRSIRLFQSIERTFGAAPVIGKQFLRSAMSIGANVAEAQSGESRADFIHKYSIALKEARECLYWLTLLAEAEIIKPRRLQPLIDETKELVAILATIIVKAKGIRPR